MLGVGKGVQKDAVGLDRQLACDRSSVFPPRGGIIILLIDLRSR